MFSRQKQKIPNPNSKIHISRLGRVFWQHLQNLLHIFRKRRIKLADLFIHHPICIAQRLHRLTAGLHHFRILLRLGGSLAQFLLELQLFCGHLRLACRDGGVGLAVKKRKTQKMEEDAKKPGALKQWPRHFHVPTVLFAAFGSTYQTAVVPRMLVDRPSLVTVTIPS